MSASARRTPAMTDPGSGTGIHRALLIALLWAAVAVSGTAEDAPHALFSTWHGGRGDDGLLIFHI